MPISDIPGAGDWLGQPQPTPDPIVPFEGAVARVPERPRIIDPAAVKHMDGRAVTLKLRTVHGRMALYGDIVHLDRDACPGCAQSIQEALAMPAPGSELN